MQRREAPGDLQPEANGEAKRQRLEQDGFEDTFATTLGLGEPDMFLVGWDELQQDPELTPIFEDFPALLSAPPSQSAPAILQHPPPAKGRPHHTPQGREEDLGALTIQVE
jgi:hypothetical protein